MDTLLLITPALVATDARTMLEGADTLGAAADAMFVPTSPHFFVAVIAGVILAAAFQLVLTDLALAAGLNVVGAAIGPDHRPAHARVPAHVLAGNAPGQEAKKSGVLDSMHSAARKLSAAFGIWTLVSVSVSVFFAAWLAVLLSGTFSVLFGALLGLVIWGLFTALVTALEARAVTSMFGALFGTARAALRSATEAAAGMFTASPRKQASEIAHEVAAAVRDEILGGEDLKHQLRDYLKNVEHVYSPRRMREELEELLDHTEIDYVRRGGDFFFDEEERLVQTFTTGGRIKPEQARRAITGVRQALQAIREEPAAGASRVDKLADTAMRAAGLSQEEAAHYRARVEDYLRKLHKDALDPDGIKRDLEQLLVDPREGAHLLRERLSAIDRDTVAAVLAERTDMTEDDARHMVDRFMDVVHGITGAFGHAGEQAAGIRERIEAKLRDYLDSLHRPELAYEAVRHDVELLFHDPRAGAEALLDRLKSIDRDTIKAMLAHRKDMTDEDAERIVRRVEEARDAVIQRAEKIRDEVVHRVEQVEHEARRQAEETAHTASTAAWWAFATTVVSAGAAVLGGTMPVL